MFSIIAALALVATVHAEFSLYACAHGELYEVEIATGQAFQIGNSDLACPESGTLAWSNGKLLSMEESFNPSIMEVQIDGSGFSELIQTNGQIEGFDGGMAYDGKNGIVYHASDDQFEAIDITTGDATPLPGAPVPMTALTFDETRNVIFGVEQALYQFDIATATWSKIGVDFSRVPGPGFVEGFTEGFFEPSSDTDTDNINLVFGGLAGTPGADFLYAFDDFSRLFKIAAATGKAEVVSNFAIREGDIGATFAPASGCRAETASTICVSASGAVNCGQCPPSSKRSVDEVKTFVPVQVRMSARVTVQSKPHHNDCRHAQSVEIDGDEVIVNDPRGIYSESQESDDGDQAFAVPAIVDRTSRRRSILLAAGEHKVALHVRQRHCAKNQVVINARVVQVVAETNGAAVELDDSSDKK